MDTHLNVSVNTYQQVDLRLNCVLLPVFNYFLQTNSACNDAKGIVTAMYNHM